MENFTIQQAIKIQRDQINYYAKGIKDKKKKAEFLRATKELVKQNKDAKTPYEIPRGTQIEELYYKINLGYSDEQYGNYCRSMD
jgi:hypothetical protein